MLGIGVGNSSQDPENPMSKLQAVCLPLITVSVVIIAVVQVLQYVNTLTPEEIMERMQSRITVSEEVAYPMSCHDGTGKEIPCSSRSGL